MNQSAINFAAHDSVSIVLPYPPSVNHYWRARGMVIRGKILPAIYLSQEGKDFRKNVIDAFNLKGLEPLHGRLKVRVVVNPPDRRKRDLDNLTKSLFDALTHAGAYLDDCQIDMFTMERKEVIKGGKVHVFISVM